ncbi:MAG TPA: hypothetical protein DCP11_01890 [Microbacteriaceae bacterium]|nr:hypothetical protein [Microbacteriaceae bacterium]
MASKPAAKPKKTAKAKKKSAGKTGTKAAKKSGVTAGLKALKKRAEATLDKRNERAKKQRSADKKRAKKAARKAEAQAKKGKKDKGGTKSVDAPAKPTTIERVWVRKPLVRVQQSAEPSASWTVLDLRARARAAGARGYSRLRKADLLRLLGAP